MTRVSAEGWSDATLKAAARCLGTDRHVPIAGAHLVGAYHAGPANLAVLRRICAAASRVAVPTTLNATSADLSAGPTASLPGCPQSDGEYAGARTVVDLLVRLGCTPTLTCAPYFGIQRPAEGDVCVWAESNAVLFANSVLGARVLRAPQYLDLACALAGRAPLADTLTEAGRRPGAVFDCSPLPRRWFAETAGFELLGLWLGERIGKGIPLLLGLPRAATETQLRSLCAAVGVASDCPMLHVAGRTPEADAAQRYAREAGLCPRTTAVRADDLRAVHGRITGREGQAVRTVAVGAPHASADQVRELLGALEGRSARVQVVLSLSRAVSDAARDDIDKLKQLGVRIVRDSCTYYGSFIGARGGPVVTPSIKWALYARANLGIEAFFGNARECRRALRTGYFHCDGEFWNA